MSLEKDGKRAISLWGSHTLLQRLRLGRMNGGAVGFVLGGEVVGELDLEFVLDGFAFDGAFGPGEAERAEQGEGDEEERQVPD